MLSHRRSCRPANGCTPERSGRVSRRAAGFARVGGTCRPPAKSQTGPAASRSVCGVTDNTALWRASVSAANQCASATPAHLSDQRNGLLQAAQHQRSKPNGQDRLRAWWRSHASAAARQRGVLNASGSDDLKQGYFGLTAPGRHSRSIRLGRHGRSKHDRIPIRHC
jgi:hypothetical protein